MASTRSWLSTSLRAEARAAGVRRLINTVAFGVLNRVSRAYQISSPSSSPRFFGCFMVLPATRARFFGTKGLAGGKASCAARWVAVGVGNVGGARRHRDAFEVVKRG